MLKAYALLFAGLSVILVACSHNSVSEKPTTDDAADEQAIRKTNEQWFALIRDHDPDRASDLYTADGVMMAPSETEIARALSSALRERIQKRRRR